MESTENDIHFRHFHIVYKIGSFHQEQGIIEKNKSGRGPEELQNDSEEKR